jgi:antitoxin (DNA-binding transcriptional repressor) of toxin-antitoxin stability system
MTSVNAKELHLNTGAVLDRLEKGETILITRNGRVIARAEPAEVRVAEWADIMADIWKAGRKIPADRRAANPVLVERARRRQ